MGKDAGRNPNLSLFARGPAGRDDLPPLDWPPAARFPLNLENASVAEVVEADLLASQSPLIVTGFAALDRLIDFVAQCPDTSTVRILLGTEPFESRRESYQLGHHSFTREVEKYWLERGISLLLSAKLIVCIERLRSGRVHARYLAGSQRLHAKIYVGDEAASLGSSNFTYPGMQGQHEANTRFSRKKDASRYQETVTIAENYWQLGRDYNDKLIALLERLLQVVPWREALARACAELLEGEWAQEYLERDNLTDTESLWPSQRKGIAQALYILDNHGSVLVADATGSGKTRMGVHLIGAVRDHIVRSNRLRQGTAIMISPPTVRDSWNMEAMRAATAMQVYSHGDLSHAKSRGHDLTIESLRRAQILCVDEGHNFLNMGSARTQHLLRNMADHVLLFTATPINKSASDLLRIANMLGADNLDESTLKAFKQMLGVGRLSRALTEPEIKQLREEINRFTVRRTKRQLNQMVEEQPDKYRDHTGRLCRYPEHLPRIYSLHESQADRGLAAEIRELASQLYAVSHFVKPIEMPDVLRAQGVSEDQYLRGRLNSARKIAAYIIMSSLRSSRLALAEHVEGTRKAVDDFGLTKFKKQNASVGAIEKLQKIRGTLPENRLSVPLPTWLSNQEDHEAACSHDWKIYKQIYGLLKKMSSGREHAKADHLKALLGKNHLVLAFDSRPITLAYIEQLIKAGGGKIEVITATGENQDKKRLMIEVFKHGSTRKNLIGLCSDSLSEGVNLQQASVIVHLDMPSVVRIAEQRVGRVDRMDSPHDSIEAWWPDDAEEFAVSSDDRFIERYETVDSLLGSNMPLPAEMLDHRRHPLSAAEMLAEYEAKMGVEEWDGITDAFNPVRQLVEGSSAIVTPDVYAAYRHVKTRVLSRVSLVRARSPWAFFCLSAGSFATPRWLMLPSRSAKAIHELEYIALALRDRLTEDVDDLIMDEHASKYLDAFIGQLSQAERSLLPRRKQRALEEMQHVLEKYAAIASTRGDQERVDAYMELLEAITKPLPEYQPNWDEVAARWLDLVRPIWHEKLQTAKAKLLVLRDIRKDLIEREAEVGGDVLKVFSDFPRQQRLDERIIACIIGVPL